jgi:hypothetical protein
MARNAPLTDRLKAVHQVRQAQKRQSERAIALAHQRPPGPVVTSVTETQPAPVRPRIKVPTR